MKRKKMSKKQKTYWSIIIPVILLFFVFNTWPMLNGFFYSLTNYKGYGTYEMVGM